MGERVHKGKTQKQVISAVVGRDSDGAMIVVSVSAAALRYAAAHNPDYWKRHPDFIEAEGCPSRGRNIKVTNVAHFAEAVAWAMNRQATDRSTLLTSMLDEAIGDAIEYECEGISG